MAEEFRVLRPREYHSQLVQKGVRSDGRALDETREIKLETDAIKTADSSSLVKFGNTSIVCGCTSRIVKNSEVTEDFEDVRIAVEMPPISSSPIGYRTNQTAQLLTRTLKNILFDCKCIEFQDILFDDDESRICVDIEVICLNYDGSPLDAAFLAVLLALKTLTIKVGNGMPRRVIKLPSTPICSSFSLLNERILSDPNLEEEAISQSCFSITIDPDTDRLCHINKVGGRALSHEKLRKCIEMAKSRSKKIRDIIRRTDMGDIDMSIER